MPFFYCLMAGLWMLVMGWYLGAIYAQNRDDASQSVSARKLEVGAYWEREESPLAFVNEAAAAD